MATVRLFGTHAGTPDDAGYPALGDAGSNRVFTNDMGWLISLDEAYVTTEMVRLVPCDANVGTEIEMFWGACPEDFVAVDDRESIALGAVTIEDGEYCRVDVTFGPYLPTDESKEHVNPANPAIEDHTIFIKGTARKEVDGQQLEVDFEILSDASVTARATIATIENGRPLTLEDENFARDLTILKTYDTFFEGVDFATATQADIEAAILAGLEQDTTIHAGSEV